MQKIHVLVVDDEWKMRNLLRIYLTKSGFQITEAASGAEALEQVVRHSFDLIVLDIMMPGIDGWEVCRKIREMKLMPILMLTARTETKDKVQGLTLGADDYLVKPFEPDEFIARVFALLRRSSLAEALDTPKDSIVFRELKVDVVARQLWIRERLVDCTPKEFDLLRFLAAHPNRVFTREDLLDQVWGNDYLGDIRTVDTHVKNIREKARIFGLSYVPVQTVWGSWL